MFSSLPFSYLFLSVMSVGTILSVSSIHWLGIWAGLEINLIGFLPMLVYQKSVSESESAVKYFIVQALGSSFIILGSLLSFNMSFTWETFSVDSYVSSLGFIIMLSGLCVKLGLCPFHYWLPGVMAGLPWITCLLLATWQKFAPLFLMLCLLELNQSSILVGMLCLFSASSSLVGGVGGMNQTQIRALLAYSSIGHLGWMTFAALNNEWSMKVYLAIYVLISISMFASLWYTDSGTLKNVNNLKSYSYMQFSVILVLLSLAGLPPLLGFVSKWLVIVSSVANPWMFILFPLVMGSLLSLFYYLSLFFSIFLVSFKKYGFKLSSTQSSVLVGINLMNLFGGVMILSSGLLNQL